MEPSLAEVHDDLETVYAKHALYHLSQQTASHTNSGDTAATRTDQAEESLAIDEMSLAKVCSSGDGKFETHNSRHDATLFNIFNISEKSSSETVGNVSEIPDQQHCVISKVELNNEEIQLDLPSDNEIQNNATLVHPVELTKSINNTDCDNHAKIPGNGNANVKVVDLMDSSSINELKRLWKKPASQSKSKAEIGPKSPGRPKKVCPKMHKPDNQIVIKKKIGRPPKKLLNCPESLQHSVGQANLKEACLDLKVCTTMWKPDDQMLVKKKRGRPPKKLLNCPESLQRSVGQANPKEACLELKVCTTMRKPDDQILVKKKRGRPPKNLLNCSESPQRSVGQASPIKTTGLELKSLPVKKCSVKIEKLDPQSLSHQNLKIDLAVRASSEQNMPKAIHETLLLNRDSKTGTKFQSIDNIEAMKATTSQQSKVHLNLDHEVDLLLEEEFDLLNDSSDDYVPSDEEYRPSGKDTLKDAFLKTHKRKSNATGQIAIKSRAKKLKITVDQQRKELNNEQIQSEESFGKPKKKYERKTFGAKRIGRPPVLGTFQCKHCSFTAEEKNLVDKHARIHRRPILKCRFCDATFRAQNPLMEHEARGHTNETPFKCTFESCDYGSKCKTDLDRHMSKHATEKNYTCKLCGWATKWRRNLRSHHLMKHTDLRKFKCPECPFVAKRNSDLKQHMFRHTSEKPIQCLQCGFNVKTNWELRSHMLTHSDEKPFACTHPGCMARTKTRADLNKHMRVHLTEYKYSCETCCKNFKCQNSLKKHYIVHKTGRAYKCDICNVTLKTKYGLRKHITLHSGVKPYKCPVCPMTFAVSNNLKTHLVTHDTKNRPFLCPLCPHAAREQDHLLAHIGTFHGKSYTYFCEICRKPFGRYGRLKVHYRRMHGNMDTDSVGQSGLSMLQLEMKTELETSESAEQFSDTTCTNTEMQVEEVTDNVKLNEETGILDDIKIDSQFNSVENGSNSSLNSFIKVEGDNGSGEICETSNASSINENTDSGSLEDRSLIPDCDIKKEPLPVICSSSTAKVAIYDGFRLPLATRGFAFNYEKSGKKPRAWFMDYELMNEKDSAKQKKYLRRIGVLPPLPKGKPGGRRKKRTLTDFVNERRKKLNDNIRKSNMLKLNFEAFKSNAKRKARFQGKYTEVENVEEEETPDKGTSSGEIEHDRQNSQLNTANKALLNPSKIPKKKRTPDKRKETRPKLKLLLSSEKKALSRSSTKKIDIRKPNFIQSGEDKKTSKGAASKHVKASKTSSTCSAGKQMKKKQSLKSSLCKNKKKSDTLTSKSDNKHFPVKTSVPAKKSDQSSSKYKQKYVPVKQRKGKELRDSKSKKGVNTKSKTGTKKGSTNSPKRSLKMKITSVKSAKELRTSSVPDRFVMPADTNVQYVVGESGMFAIENVPVMDPPADEKMEETDAALLNECDGMLDKATVLKTDGDLLEISDLDQVYIPCGAKDSGIFEGFIGSSSDDGRPRPVETVKSEETVCEPQHSQGTFVIMDTAESVIKEEVRLDADTSYTRESTELDDSGLVIKQEPEYLD